MKITQEESESSEHKTFSKMGGQFDEASYCFFSASSGFSKENSSLWVGYKILIGLFEKAAAGLICDFFTLEI